MHIILLALFISSGAAAPRAAATARADARTSSTQSFFGKIIGTLTFTRHAAPPPVDPLVPLASVASATLDARINADMRALAETRAGLLDELDYVRSHPEYFSAAGAADEATLAAGRDVWCALCDRCLSLESLGHYYDDFTRLRGQQRADAFLIRRAALLAACRGALVFSALVKNPALVITLNEPFPALGLPAGFYSRFKEQFTSRAALELTALEILDHESGATRYSAAHEAAADDARAIAGLRRETPPPMTGETALDLLRRTNGPGLYRVPPAVADDVVGGGAVERPAQERIENLLDQVDPGDILLIRREGRLAAMGQPGYWTHAALYAGTPAERKGYFNESSVKAWAIGQGQDDFEGLLRASAPEAYTSATATGRSGLPLRVIEVLGGGTGFTALERAAGAGAVAVLRPRLSKLAKAQALLRAFACNGRPSDPAEDFASDAELSDTELIRMAYGPGSGEAGLDLPLVNKPGHQGLPPNELARLFDAGMDTPAPPLDFVCFIDGANLDAGLAEFRQSWRRPKWRIQLENTIPMPAPASPTQNRLAWETISPSR